ncbi:MAG TPA: hypothetical protein VG890_12195, partial [Puia sp.]|nr:hypothetical protein [Puia sp.]
MNRKSIFRLLPAFLFIPFLSPAQRLDSMMMVYSDKFPQEKTYVQFDKRVYNPGETIWYKAYVFTGFDPSPYSKSFYAELYDASGKLIQRRSTPLSEATSSGSFDIPQDFKGSRLHVRAYTTWMMNFDTTLVFEKDLRVAGVPKDTSGASHAAATLRFFPEGGDLVGGIENNVAFIATDAYGAPVNLQGVLHDASGKELLTFRTAHNGMGQFLLTPSKSDVFYATWSDVHGVEHRTDLPAVKSSGIVLRAMNNNGHLVFSVARQQDNTAFEKVIVIAHMNQQMVYKAIVNLKDNFLSGGDIPIAQLPTGILTITAFDISEMPLAERVVFVNNHNFSFSPEVRMQAKGLTRRAHNVVEITVPDTLRCNMSLAITDAEVDGVRSDDDNIVSRLLLTGDIHGYVKDPYYYFQNNSDSVARQLDLVMLTHGWRRFNWAQLNLGKTPAIKYPVQDYLSINAEVLGVDGSRIAADENLLVILQNKDSSSQMLSLPRISKNKFGVGGLVFYDTAKAYYQFSVNHKLSSEAAVVFNTGLYRGGRQIRPYALTLPPWSPEDSLLIRKNQLVFERAAAIRAEDERRVKTLESVTVRGRVKTESEKLDEQYASGLFAGGDAKIFDMDSDPAAAAYPDIFTYLQGK